MSSHLKLYKSRHIQCADYKQTERREKQLAEQRLRREGASDQGRCLEEVHEIVRGKPYRTKYPRCDIKLQQSEWLYELPIDIDNWFMKPCPKGYRSLVIAADGKTRIFNKNGRFVREFRSNLPGDSGNHKRATTILDCIFVPNTEEYHVLDVISFGTQDLRECEAELRTFWLESRLNEMDVETVTKHNEYPFRLIKRYECGDSDDLNGLLAVHPIWPNNEPALDGFLFYHKQAWYTHGRTPLVGWLFAFMLPDYFFVPHMDGAYLIDRPANYTKPSDYFEEFDAAQRQKKQVRNQNRQQKMDAEDCDQSETNSVGHIVGEMEALEATSNVDEFDVQFAQEFYE